LWGIERHERCNSRVQSDRRQAILSRAQFPEAPEPPERSRKRGIGKLHVDFVQRHGQPSPIRLQYGFLEDPNPKKITNAIFLISRIEPLELARSEVSRRDSPILLNRPDDFNVNPRRQTISHGDHGIGPGTRNIEGDVAIVVRQKWFAVWPVTEFE